MTDSVPEPERRQYAAADFVSSPDFAAMPVRGGAVVRTAAPGSKRTPYNKRRIGKEPSNG